MEEDIQSKAAGLAPQPPAPAIAPRPVPRSPGRWMALCFLLGLVAGALGYGIYSSGIKKSQPPGEAWDEVGRLCQLKIAPRKWEYIVIHHSEFEQGNAASMNRLHQNKGWKGLGYDFVVGNGTMSRDGQIEVGYRWTEQADGAHTLRQEMNRKGIGICLVGNFMQRVPSPGQLESTVLLTAQLAALHKIPTNQIIGHRDARARDGASVTLCPGNMFPMESFIAQVRGEMAKRGAAQALWLNP